MFFTHDASLIVITALFTAVVTFILIGVYQVHNENQREKYEAQKRARRKKQQFNVVKQRAAEPTRFEYSLIEPTNPYVKGSLRYQAWNEKRG